MVRKPCMHIYDVFFLILDGWFTIGFTAFLCIAIPKKGRSVSIDWSIGASLLIACLRTDLAEPHWRLPLNVSCNFPIIQVWEQKTMGHDDVASEDLANEASAFSSHLSKKNRMDFDKWIWDFRLLTSIRMDLNRFDLIYIIGVFSCGSIREVGIIPTISHYKIHGPTPPPKKSRSMDSKWFKPIKPNKAQGYKGLERLTRNKCGKLKATKWC